MAVNRAIDVNARILPQKDKGLAKIIFAPQKNLTKNHLTNAILHPKSASITDPWVILGTEIQRYLNAEQIAVRR